MQDDTAQGAIASNDYRSSRDYAEKVLIRQIIRKSSLTRAQREITLAIVNLWFCHRNGQKGYIHPGREKIAKSTKASVKTVSRCMGILRDKGILQATQFLNGAGENPTHYKVDIYQLIKSLSNGGRIEEIDGQLKLIYSTENDPRFLYCGSNVPVNVPVRAGQNVPQINRTNKGEKSESDLNCVSDNEEQKIHNFGEAIKVVLPNQDGEVYKRRDSIFMVEENRHVIH